MIHVGEGEENLSVKKGSSPLLQPPSQDFRLVRWLCGGNSAGWGNASTDSVLTVFQPNADTKMDYSDKAET